MSTWILILTVVLIAAGISANAQRVEQVTENPNAVQLRELWRFQGNSGDEVGFGVGGVGDLDGDSYHDWGAIVRGEWLLYRGGETLTNEPFWRMDSVGLPPFHPVVGDFLGDDTTWVGFMHAHEQMINNVSSIYWQFRLYRSEQGSLPASSAPTQLIDIGVGGGIKDVQASDLDGDGDDELIVARAYNDSASVWIYTGGPDFQVETPTHVIVDPDSVHSNFYMSVCDLTGDRQPDLITSGAYKIWISGKPGSFWKTKVYFSSSTSPWSWVNADRVIEGAKLTDDTTGVPITPSPLPSVLHDADGDGIMDMIGTVQVTAEARRGAYFWLSGSGRDARTRPYDSTDYDLFLASTEYVVNEMQLGALNDSSGRWWMLPMSRNQSGLMYLLGSGEEGPNGTVDGWGGDGRESVWNMGGNVGDVNDDGWSDVIVGNFNYRSRGGIAVIFAGGAYIPNDDPTVSVREVPVAGESGGLYLWPNPVVNELHIAWRGDLAKMPSRFAVYDMVGREVVSGAVDPYRGAALWRCASVAAGTYVLTMFDARGESIATATIVKE